MSIKPRDVTPIISAVRNWTGQRKLVLMHRFEDYISPRTAPPAKLPPGINHALSENLYFHRDGRRSANPPVVLYNSTKLLESKEAKITDKKIPKPGYGYDWESGLPSYK